MSASWQAIADSLRDELVQYGRLFGMFEEQQASLFKRDAAGALRVASAIDQQVEDLIQCRRKREEEAREFARVNGQDESSTLYSMIQFVPEDARPLLRALIVDMNLLVARLRRISRHNRLFLIRTIDNHQEILRRLRPGSFTKVYSQKGCVTMTSSRRASFAAEV